MSKIYLGELITAFTDACQNNNLEKIKSLPIEQISKYYNDGLVTACAYGNLNVVKHLLKSPYTNIHFRNEKALLTAIANEKVDVVDYLLFSRDLLSNAIFPEQKIKNNSLYQDPLLIASSDLDIIEEICSCNNLTMFKYITSKPDLFSKINIHINDDFSFKEIIRKNYIDFASFLIFDLNIEKTKNIADYLKEKPNKEIENLFKIRDSYQKLDQTLNQASETNQIDLKKNKI